MADPYPRSIIRTETITSTSPTTSKTLFQCKTKAEIYDQIVDFVQMLFFKHLLVSPKERKIVMVESVLCPTEIREIFAKVLFRHFDVAAILHVPSHLVILATLAIETAVVVDLGFKEATVVPIYSGVQIVHAWQAQPLAAEAIHKEIRRQLIENGISEELLTNETVEEIKSRLCFVTTRERALKYENNETVAPPPDVAYPINGKEIINIPGKVRETIYEILFVDDNDHLSLPHIILNAIKCCTGDTRKQLLENIVLVGGTSMALGLVSRLQQELTILLKNDLYKNYLICDSIKFHIVPAKENSAAW